MISLILPYWDRQEAADKAFELLVKNYSNLDIEIIVVDDGNKVPFKKSDLPLNIKVLTLPLKEAPKSPVTPWNEGIKIASGDIIILSCIEILHDKPIIEAMLAELEKLGKDGYVLAAAWCPEQNEWHCHSTVKLPRNPAGTGLSFFGMMYKDLYWKAGGFDEEYRDGAGYEDNDFINRMLAVGAKFKICDDLVVIHPKSKATITWPDGAFERNKDLFYKKWPQKYINFVCVNWGDYCGRGIDYVNKLFDGVTRCLPGGVNFRFICFSDKLDLEGLREGITLKSLPQGVNGWWNKLYLFKEGLFEEDERVIFFDLDTVIVRSLEDIIAYKGEFAVLKDFYYDRLAPGVMLWKSGFGKEIWSSYEEAGYPTNLPLGDLSWINKHFDENSLKADILQDLFSDKFCSYKVDAKDGIPQKAAVVCFHGFPRPHEAGGWVDAVWERGQIEFESLVAPNTSVETAINNIKYSCGLDLPWFELEQENLFSRDIVIVGGSPSLKFKLDELRGRQESGQYIIATNGTYDYLTENGIMPDAHIIIDARPENSNFVKNPSKEVAYYIAAQCSSDVFEVLEGMNVTLIHLNRMGTIDCIPPTNKPINLLSGGSTVGMIAISLAHCLGFRNFHLYGMDSSYTEKEHHAYEQKLNNNENVLEVEVEGRKFKAAPWMIQQAQEFQQLASILANEGCTITVAGEGLLPHIARIMARQP